MGGQTWKTETKLPKKSLAKREGRRHARARRLSSKAAFWSC